MSSFGRKFVLTAHVTSSVGWLGAVVAFLAVSIAGLTGRDPATVRGAYLSMNLMGQFIIVPLSVAALLTGVIQSLTTPWGLFRYYWVVVKLVLTIGATSLLLLHQFTAVTTAARQVSQSLPGTLPNVGQLGTQLVGDSVLAVVVLLVTTTLGIYKPWGRTRYGHRTQGDEILAATRLPLALKVFVAIVAAIILAFLIVHLAGGGLHRHGM